MEEIKQRIKDHEGYRNTVYSDSLGKSTIGYGHLLLATDNFVEGVEYSKKELDDLFDKDFDTACKEANKIIREIPLNHIAKGVIIEMCFQLGAPRTLKFKKMWLALVEQDFNEAANQMIDSNKDYFFAIVLKKNQLHIGNVRLGPIDYKLMKSNFGIMIGNKDFRGCGVGTEVLELIKDFSFKRIKLEQLSFPAVEVYTAAMKLYEKVGFTLNDKVKKTLNKNGNSWKLVEWSMNNPFKYKSLK